MHKFVLVLAALLAALPCGGASAETVQIVAFGGSNTRGKFLPLEDAYPAQLERMLRAEGYDVAVRNEGPNGQTTAEELEKLDAAVPAGTRIVLFQPGSNDEKGRRRVNSSRDNVRAIVQRLLDRGIQVLYFGTRERQEYVEGFDVMTMPEIIRLAPDDRGSDGIHLTPNGYRIAAEKMLPRVKKLLGRLGIEPGQAVPK
jgi:acyl-CoA thioesterase-1